MKTAGDSAAVRKWEKDRAWRRPLRWCSSHRVHAPRARCTGNGNRPRSHSGSRYRPAPAPRSIPTPARSTRHRGDADQNALPACSTAPSTARGDRGPESPPAPARNRPRQKAPPDRAPPLPPAAPCPRGSARGVHPAASRKNARRNETPDSDIACAGTGGSAPPPRPSDCANCGGGVSPSVS